MKFIPFTDADRADAFALYKEALRPIVESAFGWNEQFQLERFNARYDLSCFRWIKSDGRTVGFLCSYDSDENNTALHISLLIVLSAERRRQTGTKVMKHLMSERNLITLSTFRKNTEAIRFYEKLDFKISGGDEHFIDMTWNHQPSQLS